MTGSVTLGAALTVNGGAGAGAISVSTGSVTNTVVDVYPSTSGFKGNAISGRLASGLFSANALNLQEGANMLFQVRIRFPYFGATLLRLVV